MRLSLLLAIALLGYANLSFAEDALPEVQPLSVEEREALGLSEDAPAPAPADAPEETVAPQFTTETTPPEPAPAVTQPNVSSDTTSPGGDTTATHESVSSSESAVLQTDAPPPMTDDQALSMAHEPQAKSRVKLDPEQRKKQNQGNRWSIGLAYTPRSFRLADFRGQSAPVGGSGSTRFYGTYLHGERILFQNIGVVAIGAEVGIVGRNNAENYSKTLLAMQSAGLSANYRARYVARQWVVPYLRVGGEFLRYNYRYNSNAINGTRLMPRAEGGLELFLNFLDESSAGNMYGNHGVMRSYLYAAYSLTQDSKKDDGLNLSDRALRFGLRVEF